MSASLHSKEVTTASVRAVSFGFYSDEEIKKISVKRIVNPIMFDNSKAPVEGGLYDPAFGPLDFQERCTTCGLSVDCPGHFGHIELAAPVYNPLVFATLYKLLRCCCLHCFKFRMADKEVQRYINRLSLLLRGNLTEAQGIVMASDKAAKAVREEMGGGKDEDEEEESNEEKGNESPTSVMGGPAPSRRDVPMTGHSLEAAIQTMNEIFKKQPAGRCANCGAWSPAIKKEGYSKLFLMPLPPKKEAANVAAGVTVLAGLDRLQRGREDGGNGVVVPGHAKKGGDEAMNDASSDDDEAGLKYADNNKAGLKDLKAKGEAAGIMSADAPHEDVPRAPKVPTREGHEASSEKAAQPKFLTPLEIREVVRCMWEANAELMSLIYPAAAGRRALTQHAGQRDAHSVAVAAAKAAAIRGANNYEEFFIQTLAVTPNRFRPINKVGEMMYEHPQNTVLARVLNQNLELMRIAREGGANGADGRMLLAWLALQNSVNTFIDSTTAENDQNATGIRQALEKKEGLFRKNMMGKRVNFAARSVISPDVYLNGGEIGIPPYIAARLTFPERVTAWNVERLCEAVIAGPGKNPGAVAVEDERGRLLMLRDDRRSREAIARQLYTQIHGSSRTRRGDGRTGEEASSLTGSGGAMSSTNASASLPSVDGGGALSQFGGCKVVYRSMEDGDILLTNRQPTLHKPGLMAHRARIMRDERTIRFHYANCSTFNADFDGDEINLHLPQDQLGRAEGYGIVSADRQFFVPTDGKPLRGLIQDHIVSGTLLTMRDRFFSRSQYAQLIHEAVCVDCSGAWEIWMEGPAILKPARLWTGKQVLTAVLMHYTRDQLPFSTCNASKVPVDTWGKSSGEGRLRIEHARLLAGVVDKNCFGKHGLLHFFHELYGAERTSLLTASLSRLFTAFLQRFGFTCGMSDVWLIEEAERERAELLRGADARCLDAAAGLFGAPRAAPLIDSSAALAPEDAFAHEERRVREELSIKFRANPAGTGALLDMKSSSAMHPLSSEVVRACIPGGQVKPFRHNMMALMTVTGAKGSVVNFSQISCLLGQQELEGRRVPRMASGKTLPCFSAFDVGARSGGFVGDRFLTGLRPQEYYFHCMAGREGLVDTTVKTSRSGYIQRCLVKNLEPLRVAYDGTVRDDTDSSVVQFRYGEDGIDTMRTGCLRTLPFFFYNMPQLGKAVVAKASNKVQISESESLKRERAAVEEMEKTADEELRKWAEKVLTGMEAEKKEEQIPSSKKEETKEEVAKRKEKEKKEDLSRLPVGVFLPPTTMGVTSEGFQGALVQCLFGGGLLPAAGPDAASHAYRATLRALQRCRREGRTWNYESLDPGDFARLMQLRFQLSQAAPGEAVGVVAAQSIGEPSTQMTLNTFHMAGRGEANVTLGIPRLREILMTASANIATPVMTLPVLSERADRGAVELAGRLRRILLGEALKALEVEENVLARSGVTSGGRARVATVSLQFYSPDSYPSELGISWKELANCFKNTFVPKFQQAVKAEIKKASTGSAVASVSVASVGGEEAGASTRVSTGGDTEGGRRSSENALDAESEEDEEGKTQFGQGRGEHATYDAGDEEDARLAAEARAEDAELEELEDEDDDDDEVEDDQGPSQKKKKIGPSISAAQQRVWDLEGGVLLEPDSWTCHLKLHFSLDSPKLLLRELAERVVAATVFRGTPGISKCYILDAKSGSGSAAVQTDGINLSAAAQAFDLVDTTAMYANSPAAMLEVYGVEACRASVIREAAAVFGAYGIGVDQRHLSLIADYMTHLGGYRACNRTGISASTSPFLKVTFETAAAFLVSSTLHGDVDRLTSPASRIVVGQPVAMGTGAMGIVQKLHPEESMMV